MAGAGYKLFNTGDVLTAAQVNTYLMEQTVMRFATTTARDTALSGVLAEGMLCYIDADNNIYKYTGSAWVNIDTTGGGSPLTTKGDLYTYSTTDARLGVGNNGETLVADSSTSTGLRYNPQNALANPIINGGMDIWQRGTSISVSASTKAYGADRWYGSVGANQASTISRQTTGDTTNLPNIQYATRFQRNSGQTGTSTIQMFQSLETASTIPFVGKAVTVSFYARAGANYSPTSGGLYAVLYYGTGTDQNILSTYTGTTAVGSTTAILTTTWQRFVFTGTVSTSATELALGFEFAPTGTAGAADYYEVTGVQIDLGTYTASSAPTFRRSGGTLAGELAACQRYYYAFASGSGKIIGIASYYTSNIAITTINLPVTMRTTPTLSHTTGTNYYTSYSNGSGDGFDSFTFNGSSTNTTVGLQGDTSTISGTAGYSGRFDTNNASASIAFSAEL